MRYNNDNLVDFFMPYTEEELIYKRYQEIKHNAEQLAALYRSLTSEQQRLNQYMMLRETESVINIDDHFPAFVDTTQDIRVEKHKRYSIATPHDHAFFELIYVLKGTCNNKIEEKSIRMQESDICLLSPGIVHSMGVFDDSLIINVMIRKSVFQETFFSITENDSVLMKYFTDLFYTHNANHYMIFHTQGDNLLHSVMESLIWEEYLNRFDKYSDAIKKRLLEAIFNYLLRNHAREMETSKELYSEHPRIMEMLSYLRENYRTATLRSAAVYLHYTPQHLSRLIHKETGLRFTEILTNIRVQKACDLLKNTDLKILDISSAVGYENPEYFNVAFKEKTNHTPRSYRKQFGKQRQ